MSTSEAESWRPNVAAIILDAEDNVLLGITGRASHHVHFPQGGVDRGESMAEAVLREVREEVGLQARQLTILARLGGLRYRYRNKNRKSRVWDGQEQTYFVLRCTVTKPAVDLSGSSEFAAARWVPWYTLEPGMFVSFKQAVMRQVLEHFFPRHLMPGTLQEHLLHTCRSTRYLSPPGNTPPATAADDRFLFAGGKEEAEYQFSDAARELLDLQRRAEKQGLRLLILPLALPGSGLRPCLRRLGRCLDPLRTHIITTAPQPEGAPLTSRLLTIAPRPGQVIILAENPYSTLLHSPATPCELQTRLAELTEAEQQLEQAGIRILRLFLNTSEETALKHCLKKGTPITPENWRHLRSTAGMLMQPSAWYLLPSDRRWYRDLMAIRTAAETLGSC